MSAAPKMAPASQTPPRRSFHRFPINVPLDVIVLRSGIPDSLPGRCVDLSKDGVGAVVAGELCIGQQIGIEFRLPNVGVPVRARVVVRYHDQLRCGLQFLGLSSEQIGMIQYWAHQNVPVQAARNRAALSRVAEEPQISESVEIPRKSARKIRIQPRRFYAFLIAFALLAFAGWWEWQRAWRELEADASTSSDWHQASLPLRVSADVMEKRIISKIDPVYPEDARLGRIEGLVILDATIAPDGTVKHLRPVSGPYVLARSALDAVQSWRFEPYRLAGQPIEVETTIAVDFRLH